MTPTLHRTECITFPRSGHTLLHRLLERYFSDDVFVYCEQYETPERVLDLDERTNFQKNHDLDLETRVRTDRRYLVQVRYPIESITSWYERQCRNGHLEDAAATWTSFAIQQSSFWMRFYRKWVLDFVPERLVVTYDDLVTSPAQTLGRIVAFLGDPAPDPARLAAACGVEDIRRRRKLDGFAYYGPGFFAMLRGLFAAVPGVDIAAERLVVPDEADPLAAAAGRAVQELEMKAREVTAVASRLRAAATRADVSGTRSSTPATRLAMTGRAG